MIVGRNLEYRFDEQRVSSESGRRLGEVAIELELPRFGGSLQILWARVRMS